MKFTDRNHSYKFTPLIFAFCFVTFISMISIENANGQNTPDQNPNKTSTQKLKPAPSPTPAKRPRPSELQKALNEFRIQMGQAGGAGGARKLKASGKQNSLTGRVYENFRNDFLDAVPHEVRQRGGAKSLLRRNQYGFSVSGPVVAPRIYDGRGRTFFSVSFEGTRERVARSALFTVPTDKQRGGDFSDLVDSAGRPVLVYDPATTRLNPDYDPSKPVSADNPQYLRDPFPNNVIPENRIDPVARALVGMYPKSNISVGPFLSNNYWINSPFENQADGVIGKLDHRLTEKHQLSANFNYSSGLRKSPEFFPEPANSGSPSYEYENGGLTLADTYTASPRVIWTFRGSASYSKTDSLEAAAGQDYPKQLGLNGLFSTLFPRFVFSGSYLSIGPPTAVFRDRSYSYNGSSSVSINRKSHTLRLTALASRSHVNSFSPSYPSGLFVFGNSGAGLPGVVNTGNGFAQFLLGMVTRAEEGVVLHPSYYSKNFFELNASDEYRMRPGVTVNFSLSLEVATPRIEKYDRQSTVSLEHINPENGKPGALIFAGRDGVGRALQPVTARWEPSVGLAVNPWNDRDTIVRLNYSLNYGEYPLYGRHFGTNGFNAAPVFNSTNDQLEPAFLLRDGMPLDFQQPPFLDPTAANGTEADYVDPSGLLPVNQQWSLGIQRELPRSLALEARYTGWRGAHQFVDSFIRLNAVPVEHLQYRDQLYDDAFRNSLRPYPQYRGLDLGGIFPGGDVEGHSLAMTLDQRLTGGVFGRVSYRLAKVMDNYSSGAAQDPHNLRDEWSLSDTDVTHSVQVSYTYELPFGKGKKLFNDDDLMSRLMSPLLGGLSLSGLTTWRNGAPLIIRPLFNRTGGIVNNLRVNVVPGVDPAAGEQSPQQWFNPAAFAQPDDFTLGNASRTHPNLREPGDQFHHLSLTKRIDLSADTSLEFVTEAFNFPNHANLNDPDTRIGPESSPNLNAGKIIGSTGGRVMQMGLRILF
ncbi:MAG: hypothetical protein AB7U82_21155 [Blastocatellales bacterium]